MDNAHINLPFAKCLVERKKVLRKVAVELLSIALIAYSIWANGINTSGLVWGVFAFVLLTAGLMDWDTTILPDILTMPLLWLGLIFAALQWIPLKLESSLLGVVGGYLSLWIVSSTFKVLTGRVGIGYGDLKLLAALGAWFGWQTLIPVCLLSTLLGGVAWTAMKYRSSLFDGEYVPFGPALSFSGLFAMVYGPQAMQKIVGM